MATIVRTTPIDTRSAWRGEDLVPEQWVYTLSDTDIEHLEEGLRRAEESGCELWELDTDSFPVAGYEDTLAGIGDQLDDGLGFLLIRGLNVARYTQRQAELLFFGLGAHLGRPMIQNSRGHILGHVMDEGKQLGERGVRGYQTSASLSLHTDRFSDVVGLLCWRQATVGGDSVVVSATHIYNELLKVRPDLCELLFEPWPWMQRDEVPPGVDEPFEFSALAEEHDGKVYFRLNREVLEKSRLIEGAEPLTKEQQELLQVMDEIAERPGVALHMRLAPGDIQLLNNYVIVHGRGQFEDAAAEDASADARHLFRLWLDRATLANPTWARQKPYGWLSPANTPAPGV